MPASRMVSIPHSYLVRDLRQKCVMPTCHPGIFRGRFHCYKQPEVSHVTGDHIRTANVGSNEAGHLPDYHSMRKRVLDPKAHLVARRTIDGISFSFVLMSMHHLSMVFKHDFISFQVLKPDHHSNIHRQAASNPSAKT